MIHRLAPAFVLALLLAAAGCQHSRKRTIAVLPKCTSLLFWVSVHAGAAAAGRDFNVDILWNGPAMETDYTRQVQIFDSMIARHVDGIAVAAAERKALVASIDRAAMAKIPVTVFDSGLDSENYMSYVATDNVEAGRIGARALAKLLNGRGTVAVIKNAPGSQSTMDREKGFEDVLAKDYPELRLVATQYGMSDRAKSLAGAENILTAHPELDGFFASCEASSLGIAQALKSRGLNGKVKFVAFDSSDAMIEDLKSGTIQAMVVQDPFKMGYTAVKTLVDKLNGAEPAKRVDLNARVIARADLEQPDVQKLLKPDLK
jgi:ribose transport system substrate-binding protein